MKKYELRIILFMFLFSLLFVTFIPVVEAITLKEFSSSSSGNCRIVNNIEAIKHNKHISIYIYDNSKEHSKLITHALVIDDNGIIIDKSSVSKKEDSLDGKDLAYFENRKENKPTLIYSQDYFSKEYLTITAIVVAYSKVFTYTYKLVH